MSRSSGMHATTSSSSTTTTTTTTKSGGCGGKKLKGVRCRKWGKWVSEIRVPGTQERLWLGTYATPEAAAVAHDVAVYCLRRPPSLDKLNFPETLSSYSILQQPRDLSPRSVQKVASDVAMDVDARNIIAAAGGTTQQQTGTSTCERGNNNVGVGAGVHGSAAGVSWWDGLGDDHDCGTFHGSESEEAHGEGEALSISVEDYF